VLERVYNELLDETDEPITEDDMSVEGVPFRVAEHVLSSAFLENDEDTRTVIGSPISLPLTPPGSPTNPSVDH